MQLQNLSFFVAIIYNFIMTQNPQQRSKSGVQLLDLESHSMYSNHLNNSSSKMQYSMSKDQRFKPQKAMQYKFYDLPSTITPRSASFGFGGKLDISKLASQSPPPNTYKIPSQFERKKSNAIAIGLGRELIKAVSLFDQRSSKVPGPGTYDVKELPSMQKISLSGRIPDLSDRWIKEVPGPGTYKTFELLDKNLKSNISNFQSIRTGRFSKGEERGDFERQIRKKNIPGPGQYKTINYQVAEKFKQNRGRSFGKEQRPSIANRSFAPGPGSYKYVSQFIQ